MGLKYFRLLPIPFKYLLILAGIVSTIFIFREYTSYLLRNTTTPFFWFQVIASTLVNYFLWALLTPVIFIVYQSFIIKRRVTVSNFAKPLLLSIFITFAYRVASSFILSCLLYLKDGRWHKLFESHSLHAIVVGFFGSFIEYWIIVGIFLALDYYRKFREKELALVSIEKELVNSQLNALKMQLNPHFLFNTLHTVSSLMEESTNDAQKVLSRLGNLLRTMLNQHKNHTSTLLEEIDFIKNYLDIEQIRFSDRLHIQYDIPANTLSAQIPHLILQPLAENAIKHGFSNNIASGFIKIASRKLDGKLELTLEDNGKGTRNSQTFKAKEGIGIANVKNRLKYMYGNEFSFEMKYLTPHGFMAKISLPFKS